MNILFFNRSFYPDTEATGQFLTELCEDLTKQGHSVTVVAGQSYHVGNKIKSYLIRRERHELINILRVSGTTLPKRILLFRLINLGTYFLLAFIAAFFTEEKPDVVVAQTDPPVSGLLGIFFSNWYRAKFIYSCKDIYPDIGIITGRLTNPFLNFLLGTINMISFRLSDKVICLGEDMKKRLIEKGINENKIAIVHDWADINILFPIPKKENNFISKYNLGNNFTVMYSGNIGLTQGLEKLIDVAEYFTSKKNVKFLLVGEGAEKPYLQKLVKKKELLNIEFLPYQPLGELRHSLSAPDIHLITLQKGLAGVIVPSKIYGILACGRPFIGCVDSNSEVALIATKYKCGVTVPPSNTQELIDALDWAIKNKDELEKMGENGRKAACMFYDRKISVSKFNEIIRELDSK